MMYEDESLSVLHLFGSERSTSVNGPSALVQQFVPTTSLPADFNILNLADVKSAFYGLDPSPYMSQFSIFDYPGDRPLIILSTPFR